MASGDGSAFVALNVGGRTFQTVKRTLEKAPFFEAMFRADSQIISPGVVDPSGNILIDLDPWAFDVVLTHLRSCAESDLTTASSLVKTYCQNDPLKKAKLLQALDFLGFSDGPDSSVDSIEEEHLHVKFIRVRLLRLVATLCEVRGSWTSWSKKGRSTVEQPWTLEMQLWVAQLEGCTVAKRLSPEDAEWKSFENAINSDDSWCRLKEFVKLKPPPSHPKYHPGAVIWAIESNN
uniref:Potassium channel tetramerisation-type BTB domain-containing protein n=1 Tax=Chromera velia CCMP2878 TaxID=1169474 RepID=A0A0G4IC64_9ALVE|mmetsp:Transcript_47890/g.94481  ORF Transcript_47890/g.94481 Transcript_47890/m.94481 type:complete len:234 (+) Transcript_47890:117-818(+)|eukprot:Cvel_13059.t1-p1 / transcript=Cvel_13059.t1 / gene=Cvel_13059 / organism=Chromera_velia_CCMP2878 / gene_product=hypothetical protein / transcript_product=hypothetical protein / location=Cvel_scaffold879:1883-4341(-) / protein_length=233 / sequence_SO=supercontig / SO=protein_coding / is_pseudo=false